jgi:hypothetical protein
MKWTAYKFAVAQISDGKFPIIGIYTVSGDHFLIDNNDHFLANKPFKKRGLAINARSRAIEMAHRKVFGLRVRTESYDR